MAVQYNLDPFAALKIFYQGETDGFSEEDFVCNERERGVVLPRILRQFLSEYGYMSLNRTSDGVRLLHPNIMSQRVFSYGDNRELPLLIIGRAGDYQIAVSDEKSDDPRIFMLHMEPGQAQIMPSDDTLSEIFKVMLCGVMVKCSGAVIADDPELAVRLLKENGTDLLRITFDPSLRREYSISFSEETRTFITAEFISGELARFFFLQSEKFRDNFKESI